MRFLIHIAFFNNFVLVSSCAEKKTLLISASVIFFQDTQNQKLFFKFINIVRRTFYEKKS